MTESVDAWAARIQGYSRALEREPGNAALWNDLGNALLGAGHGTEAEACFRQALALAPDMAAAHYNLGNVFHGQGRTEDALACYGRAAELAPSLAAAHYNCGVAAQSLERDAEAEAAYRRALAPDPDLADARSNLVIVLRRQGRALEAVAEAEAVIERRPDDADTWNNLAAALKDLGRLEDAETAVRRALTIDRALGRAWRTLGNILFDARRATEAEAAHRQAVALAPDDADAHWGLSLALLLQGRLEEGFAEYESRLARREAAWAYRDRGAPLWRGESLAGKRLLLYAEQGLGDTLQFVRYAPLVAALGATVGLAAPAGLHRLLARTPGLSTLVDDDGDAVGWDCVCPLMSLPHRLGATLETIPAAVPYLHPDPAATERWRLRLDGVRAGRPAVGIVWAGDPRKGHGEASRIDRRRSIPLADFATLLDVPDVAWVSLQKGAGADELAASPRREAVIDWTAELTDFADTAALAANLDLVVCVDTSVAHLAGGLGLPTWMLSRFDGCWRWLAHRNDSPWYPTLRLFRQERLFDWSTPLQRLRHDLTAWREARRG